MIVSNNLNVLLQQVQPVHPLSHHTRCNQLLCHTSHICSSNTHSNHRHSWAVATTTTRRCLLTYFHLSLGVCRLRMAVTKLCLVSLLACLYKIVSLYRQQGSNIMFINNCLVSMSYLPAPLDTVFTPENSHKCSVCPKLQKIL